VLDSSVLVPFWSRTALQQLAVRDQPPFIPVWSEWIIAETWRVLTWRWLERRTGMTTTDWQQLADTANRMMRYLLPAMRHASLHGYSGPDSWPSMRDANDVPVWDTATAVDASYVISHNTTDFPPLVDGRHTWQGIEYLTAIEFIEDVLGLDIVALITAPLTPAMLLRSNRTR
jgi:predicted nucleic acid-binding protein